MLNLKKSVIIAVVLVVLLAISNSIFATGINMNLSSETNAINNSTLTNDTSTNITSAVVSTVENVEDSHNSTFGINTILDILLIAIGLVIILLAIAILIRLKH